MSETLANKLIKSPNNARTIKAIERLYLRAKEAYYNTGNAIMPDAVFDTLEDRLREIAPKSKALKQVGASLGTSKRKKVKHTKFMGSLTKVRPGGALTRWMAKYPGPYVVSDKLDGISLTIQYRKGQLPQVLTRGKGAWGFDVSPIFFQLRHVPKLPGKDLLVRGEAIIPAAKFKAKYGSTSANARNFVSGQINRDNPSKALKDVEFIAYRDLNSRQLISRQLKQLRRMGFRVVPHRKYPLLNDTELTEAFFLRRKKSKYEIDGVVVEQDQNHTLPRSGNPAWSVAFKTQDKGSIKQTTVVDVVWTASKHGYLKPRIKIKPVRLSGALVTWVTGHNFKNVKDQGIGPGALIEVTRSGDVIPYIVTVVIPARKPSLPNPNTYRLTDTGVDAILLDVKANQTVRIKRVTSFFRTLGVEGIAEGLFNKIIESGLDDVTKIMRATTQDFAAVSGIRGGRAYTIWAVIKAATTDVELPVVMHASGFFGRGFGSTRLNAIYAEYPNILTTLPSIEEVGALSGFSIKSATAFVEALPDFIRWLVFQPITLAAPPPPILGGRLEKEVVVFTGFRDKHLAQEVVRAGGKYSGSLTKAATILVYDSAGKAGAKLTKARDQGVKIMTVDDFRRLLFG